MNGSHRAFPVLLVVVFLPGCHIFETAQPMPVRVIDAETRAPIQGATIHLSAPHTVEPLSTMTGSDGVASPIIRRGEHEEWTATVSANGYLPGGVDVPPLDSPAGSKTQEVKLFAGPAPTVRLTLPNGYRGVVNLKITPDASLQPAREFTATAAPTGEATVVGPPVIQSLNPTGVMAVYASGTPIPTTGSEKDVLFHWIRTGGQTFTFFVGSKDDCDSYRKSIQKPFLSADSGGSASKGGGGGGRRGGGRRGGGM